MEITPDSLRNYVRAANFLSASQIYLQDNFLVNRELRSDDIKPRLLGHWGTCPGINFVYANLNRLIKENDLNMMFMLGPGHGFPALQANLFLEGSLSRFYPQAKHTEEGIQYISKEFSWPYGFPSHSSPVTPGVILEGGELGYSLSTAYGAVLDNPDLIVSCLIGDGEAETGPIATAWHLNKLVDPRTNGAVLPIVHINGYKISGPTFYGRMDNEELTNLFKGYGYKPYILEEKEDIYEEAMRVFDYAYADIKRIQEDAREFGRFEKPQWPVILMKTPKGWTGIKEFDGEKIEGNCLSHQVVLKEAKENSEQLRMLENWLRSYRFKDLFDQYRGFAESVTSVIPDKDKVMGLNKHAFGGSPVFEDLILPDSHKHAEDASVPGTVGSSSMRRAGEFLNDVFKLNKKQNNFRLFSPDETYSNKLDKVFETTSRAFLWPHKTWDKDISYNGRVMEMLSEHSLQGLIQGYCLTGRHGVFASYEAFIQIITSMVDQYAKFLKVAREVPWRGDVGSLNYILTSSGWRQEHNGFSHQNPGFIDDMLQRQGCFVNVYFPPDGNSTLAVLEKSLRSKNEINIIVAGKTLEPRWLTVSEAKNILKKGYGIWDFASDENPDIVFTSVGDYLTKETLAAITILKKEAPSVKIRFVNIMTLSSLGLGRDECSVTSEYFEDIFTKDKPVIFNFHGYPQTLKQILFDYSNASNRFKVNGYEENGSTTTPFDMHVRNGTSRYDLVIDACIFLKSEGTIDENRANSIIRTYREKIQKHGEFIRKNGTDPEEITNWKWENKS